jgi:GntR family transcriptional regulator
MVTSEKLNRSSPLALHEQLSERIRALIGSAGDEGRLPSEDELARTFEVSRATVRRAVETLVEEGELVRRQGRGTFIARPRVVSHLDRLSPFVDAFTDDDQVETRLLRFTWASGPEFEVPAALGGPEGEALMFERLYLSEGAAHALVRVFVPPDIGRRVTRAQIEMHPIYHVLRDELNETLREAHVTVRCEPAGPAVAEALGVAEEAWLLVLNRATTRENGEVVEVATHFLRPDIYQLELTAHGGSLPRLIRLPVASTPKRS